MKVVIIHYHLNRGGVTQVIANHLQGLSAHAPSGERTPVALLYGGRSKGWREGLPRELARLDVSLRVVPELDYDNVRPGRRSLAEQLRSTLAQAGFLPRETVLHVHNHSLGKNAALPGAVRELGDAGYPMVLQIHDFSEDFRPDNYRNVAASPVTLYPQAPHVHYAVLNSRDRSILQAAGVETSRLHLLPNAVADFGPLPRRKQARAKLAERFGIPVDHRFVLCPIRGIRRKNLGEVLLWSALAEVKTWFGVTLPPLNPLEQPSYARWKELAVECGLPCAFELGADGGLEFKENLSAADLILTTSVAEGFGLVFLESWLAGRSLVGRDLPEITSDFVSAGMRFDTLRPSLLVPVDWIGKEAFRGSIEKAFADVLAAYGEPSPAVELLRAKTDDLVHDGLADFAAYTTSMQQTIIKRVASDTSSRELVRAANPWIVDALRSHEANQQAVEHNAEVVRSSYSLASCGRRLSDIYHRVRASDRDHSHVPLPHGERILQGFLDISRFHPLRVEA